MKRLTLVLVCSFSFLSLFSQSKITGKVMDEELNEVMPFANVQVKGTTKGATTDFDGAYSIEVEPGSYTLVFSFMGYASKEITDVVVKDAEVVELNVSMATSNQELEEVVVVVSAKRNTDMAMLTMQKKSAGLMDGLSSENFKKTGTSNLASAVKRAPGVSVQDGKYVYVRGLGDRYTKSILNGIDIPGLDPDRNTIQMDLFPTNIIDNVQVMKSSTADLPADFTGGIVNVVIKDFPTRKSHSFSLGTSYNPSMHFNSNYLSYKGGKTDFLGFDDGSRAQPSVINSDQIPDPRFNLSREDANRISEISREFSPYMAAIKSNSLMNFSFGYSGGNQYDLGKNKLGVLGAISYKNNTQFYENAQDNYYNRSTDSGVFELEKNRTQIGDIGINSVIISALGGVSYKAEKSKYKLNVLHIQNGVSRAGYFRQETRFSDFIDFNKDNLEYTQRSITNVLFNGNHSLKENWKLEWKLSPTLSKIYDKDVRTTTFQDEDGVFSFQENTEPKRIWRNLDEQHLNSKVDITNTYNAFGEKAKLQFGALANLQERNFFIAQYSVSSTYTSNEDWDNYSGNADNLFAPENLWDLENPEGTYINANTTIIEDARKFDSRKTLFAGYISNEFKLFNSLRTIVGLRAEAFDLYYTGKNSQQGINYIDENVISALDLFPSTNFVYEMSENTNLRSSYSRTTARPSFKEASIAEIFDPLSNMTFIGNIDIKPSYIHNIDLRYEHFGEKAQMYAFSAFYKSFKDPIELTYFESAPTNFTPKNFGSADVLGVEFEIRKSLDFISNKLEKFRAEFNVSLIESRLTYSESERKLRELGLRDGESLGNYRTLQGQSPFLVNAGINYDNREKGFQAGLFYNVQGKTLQVVGTGFFPDVYTMPFHSLNFNLNKSFGKDNKAAINFKVSNILGDERESFYQSYNATPQYFSFRPIGRTFSVGFSYKL